MRARLGLAEGSHDDGLGSGLVQRHELHRSLTIEILPLGHWAGVGAAHHRQAALTGANHGGVPLSPLAESRPRLVRKADTQFAIQRPLGELQAQALRNACQDALRHGGALPNCTTLGPLRVLKVRVLAVSFPSRTRRRTRQRPGYPHRTQLLRIADHFLRLP